MCPHASCTAQPEEGGGVSRQTGQSHASGRKRRGCTVTLVSARQRGQGRREEEEGLWAEEEEEEEEGRGAEEEEEEGAEEEEEEEEGADVEEEEVWGRGAEEEEEGARRGARRPYDSEKDLRILHPSSPPRSA